MQCFTEQQKHTQNQSGDKVVCEYEEGRRETDS